jgi:hypothetical protein
MSMPSLTTGRLVARVSPESADELFLQFHGGEERVGWSTQPNVFTRAREAGANTAVVGWFHPYCRLFGGAVTACFWDSLKTPESHAAGVSDRTLVDTHQRMTACLNVNGQWAA